MTHERYMRIMKALKEDGERIRTDREYARELYERHQVWRFSHLFEKWRREGKIKDHSKE